MLLIRQPISGLDSYTWYDNNVTYKDVYGALYNGYVIETEKICPIGYHVPSDAEIEILDNNIYRGATLKEEGYEHWDEPNNGATNEYDFTALPGGKRDYYGGFIGIRTDGFWWINDGHYFYLRNTTYYLGVSGTLLEEYGLSVRCIKD